MLKIDLEEIASKEIAARKPNRIHCCTAAGCLSAGAEEGFEQFQKEVDRLGLTDTVQVAKVGCMRLCCQGPLVKVQIADSTNSPFPIEDKHGTIQNNNQIEILFHQVHAESAKSIVAGFTGQKVEAVRGDFQSPFFQNQVSVILDNSGNVEPERIESYIAAKGYKGLYQVLHHFSLDEVIHEITRSGLRGRGGAAYPTGIKWGTVAKNKSEKKYVVCNADEGDPGAFMNRSLLESDPHRVLEGMAIAGYALGSSQGYIYVRGEYPLAVQRLQIAITQANRLGILGTRIFGTPFDFRIDLRTGAGAFVCGEETALMASIMGQRGTPTPRPPYPAEHGLWGMPTLLNNVETYGNIAAIIRNGSDWFAGMGTQTSKGTKVFCLTGNVVNTGLVEVPLGTPIHKIVYDIGGGAVEGNTIKAVQTGGPSGGCIPAEMFDVPVDYDSLAKLGSILGSGGMIALDNTNRMVDVARFFMQFCMDESCGKCIPCRAGTVQIHRLLRKILAGSADHADLDRLEQLCVMVKDTSLCGLGQSAPNPTLSTLKYFRSEYESLLKESDSTQRINLPLLCSSAQMGNQEQLSAETKGS